MAITKIYRDNEWDDILSTLSITSIPDDLMHRARINVDGHVFEIEAPKFLDAVAYIEGDVNDVSPEIAELASLISNSQTGQIDITLDVDKFKSIVESKFQELMSALS